MTVEKLAAKLRLADALASGPKSASELEMDYGFEFGGIIDMDFLRAARALINLDDLTITFGV